MAYLLQTEYDYRQAKKLMAATPSWPVTRAQRDLLDHYAESLKCSGIAEKLTSDKPDPPSGYFARLKEFFDWEN